MVRLDQSQSSGESNALVFANPEKGIGQTFRPASTPLHRIDVQVRNRGDERPARIRVWRWQGSREKTEESSPLFEDLIGMAGIRHTWHTRSAFPDLPVEPGHLYYFRIDADGRGHFELRANRRSADLYPPGRLVARHLRDVPDEDLWFQTWTYDKEAGESASSKPVSLPPTAQMIRWSPPREKLGDVDAAHYLRRVERHIERARKVEESACGTQGHRQAFLEAFLYELSCEADSCEEKLAHNAMDALRRSLEWQHCEFAGPGAASCKRRCKRGPSGSFDWLDEPIDAYETLRDSPSWDPRLGEKLRKLFIEKAQEQWPRRQLNTGSRGFVGASVLLRLAKLFPESPDADPWREYGESVWRDFRENMDYQGASAFYLARAWWPTTLRLAEIMGESETLWRQPGFRELVDRYFDQTAPLGVLPGYGDATGWGTEAPGLVWLFEEATRRTGEGRYRWLAHQIFRYNSERAREGSRAGDSWGPKMHHLARAYLAARSGSEAPEQPSPLEFAPGASQSTADTWWRLGERGRLGQTFLHPGGFYVRIDLRLRDDRPDERPLRARVWRWEGSVAETKKHPPLHSAGLVLTDRTTDERIESAFVVLPDDEAGVYYLELEASRGGLQVAGGMRDPYREGRAFGEMAGADADLWFETRVLRGYGSTITHRLESEELPVAKWQKPPRVYRFTGRRIPDKLVLRSGPRETDLYALVNLLSGYRHGQPSLGGFSAIIDQGSVVLSETSFPYWEYTRRPEEENVAMIRRYHGGTPQEPGKSVEIDRFRDTPNLTVAWLRFQDVEGWGVPQQRRIYFAKNRFIWVRDRFEIPAGMTAAVGAIWHPDVLIAPKSPEVGYRIAYPHPLQNVWPFDNPARFARLWMPARPETVEAHELMPDHVPSPHCARLVERSEPIPADCRISPAHALHRSWTGQSEQGRIVWIDSLIVPEGVEQSTRLERLPSVDPAVALAIETRGERWILLDNPERSLFRIEGLETDALYLFLRERPGEDPYVHAAEATRLHRAELRLESEVRSSTERGSFSP